MGTSSTQLQQIDVIEKWSPKERAVHCSNCANCKVTKDADGLGVYCAKGHGEIRPISIVIRVYNPRGWRNANTCADFVSMDG